MARVEPGAKCGDLAQGGRVGLPGEVHGDAGGGHDGRLVGVESGRRQLLPPRPAGLEVHRHEPQPLGDAEAEFHQPLALPVLRTGLVDLEDPQAGGDLRSALGEGVQAGAEEDVLADAPGGLLGHQILDEPGPGHDGGPEAAGEVGVHVRALAPPVVGGHQLQADLVVEHMRRRVDLDVHGPPQGDPHGRAVRCRRAVGPRLIVGHWLWPRGRPVQGQGCRMERAITRYADPRCDQLGEPTSEPTYLELPAVNEQHLELCSSAEWADAVRRWIIPWVLEGISLGDRVLEIGPGPGRTTEVLADLAPDLTAVEIDPTLARALADRMAGTEVEVIEGDATDLPWAEGSFSSVLSFTMLHHLPSVVDQDRLFAEALRVLGPGGVFAGTDSLDSPAFRDLHVGDICIPIDPTTLADRLHSAGFDQVQVDTNEYGVRFRAGRAMEGV